MENKGTAEMFLRSLEKHSMRYTVFVGDGDSGCFGYVKQELEKVYGDAYPLRKEEFQGHVQKRTGLREMKKGYVE